MQIIIPFMPDRKRFSIFYLKYKNKIIGYHVVGKSRRLCKIFIDDNGYKFVIYTKVEFLPKGTT